MQAQSQKRLLILASSSPYRQLLLERLGLPFEVFPPAIDETPAAGESAAQLVARLAHEKARVIAHQFPAAFVIGCDQVAVHQGRLVGKPGTAARARQQLAWFSGSQVDFLSAVVLRCQELDFRFATTVVTEVCFRNLSEQEINRYVERDNPVDCAGGFKSEETGTTLLSAMRADDPTAIIGLPLISLSAALRDAGYILP